MHLQISAFLLFALFTAGHSLFCNQCPGQQSSCDQIPCPSGFSSCFAATAYASALGSSTSLATVKSCAPANGCPSGSINLGNVKLTSYCCSTDLCNKDDAPDPSNNMPNGNLCYTCVGVDCTAKMACTGSEDRCMKATWTLGGQTLGVKGCVSKSICDAASLVPNVKGISCCQGNLCNGAKSITQSFLFLCFPLLSFILMH
ncbi:lymphocyte antigen 6 family member M6 precursor [Danio rerio]|uniref:Lymphocyte antigen 6 family member M6 n=1 Tax=Danio rerio TaxID=7955 RepID=A0A0R4IW80_DANRE|nr:lymphocyte antigen 6 family member M6 precursor [Danio rerio]|eukprot:XP_002665292.1 urokinase plasminogen activator surface receptor-like [Danio rerio]